MGTRITVGSWPFEAESFSVQEDATPLAGGDTTGSVGTISFSIPQPDPDVEYAANLGAKAIRKFGPEVLLDRPLRLQDSSRGFTLGTVSGVSSDDESALIRVTAETKLGKLNIYGVQAAPFVGTLNQAFHYYLSRAGVTTDLYVDPLIADRSVVLPGWNGELWHHLKQMAQAHECDISYVSGVIILRPIRARVAVQGRDISRSRTLDAPSLAQFVEVYQYNNAPITDQLIYPPGGWTPEVEVLNVNAGETATYTLELSASVSSIQTPTHETFVSDTHSASSVFTVVANDGLPVDQFMWRGRGGEVRISINPDTTSLTVFLRGASGVPLASGGFATNFSLALGSDSTGNRYSTLRIVGSGVRFNKIKRLVRTGVPASRAGTEVGTTVDNPFISSHGQFRKVGARAARVYSGPVPGLTGSVRSVNKRGDTGDMTLPEYGQVEESVQAVLGSTATYAQVRTFYNTTQGLASYGEVKEYWFSFVRDDFTNQAFGNVAGARIFDSRSRRWYRIRTATLQPDRIDFTAEDDLLHGDVQEHVATKTYGDLKLELSGLTYRQAELAGLF